MGLIVAVGDRQTAGGDLFWDDGEGQDTVEDHLYQHYRFTFDRDVLRMEIAVNGADVVAAQLQMGSVRVLGVQRRPVSVAVGDQPLAGHQIAYSADDRVLHLSDLKLSMSTEWQIRFE